MPRDGSNVYHIPPGTEGVPDTVIESAKYNTYITDIEQDLNAARPILAGGTGSNSAETARTALGVETASQIVTNYDSHVFTAGSFSSASSATGSPVASHAFAGIVYMADSNNLIVEARDLDDTVVPPRMYVRQKKASVWGAWSPDFNQAAQNTINDGRYVNVTGDTMTGDLMITPPASALLKLNKIIDGVTNSLQGLRNGVLRWQIQAGSGDTESGGNTGSNLLVVAYSDAGVLTSVPLLISRATGLASVAGNPTVALGIATKQYADLSPKLAGGQTFTGGFGVTVPFQGQLSGSFTPNPFLGNYQHFHRNTSALVFNPPSIDCAIEYIMSNQVGTSGPMSFSGYTVAAGNTGDPLTDTPGNIFILSIRRMAGVSTYTIKALQ